jgi:DNA-binding NtrC family response regulator
MTCAVTAPSRLLEPISNLPPDEVIFANSPVMGRIRQKLGIAAGSKIAVSLRGQSDNGKQVLAKLIHSQSPFLSAAQKLKAQFRMPHLN